MYAFTRLKEDAHLVLSSVTQPWSVPAEALGQAIEHQGWTVVEGLLPEGQLCTCDAWQDTVIVSADLTCPKVRHWILATQLAQIRLNSRPILAGEKRPAFEKEATEYAMAFLLPHSMLTPHLKTSPLIDDEQSSQRLAEHLSDYFQVPVACVLDFLDDYTDLMKGWVSTKRTDPNSGFWAAILNGFWANGVVR